ncbi:MAG: enoyl-CoA hydratase [Phycisphaerae bacterium]|nr:MAG: enoyl-CoA hydratase [Phycisphaerae bacterium]
MSDLVLLTTAGNTAILTLHRPEARNAMSVDLLAALNAALDGLAQRADISVLTITGAGKSFCAGMDLKAVLDSPNAMGTLLHALADVCLKIRALPMVTLAKVHGAAIGGGCGLACVCDLAITHADAKVGYPEVDLGVCPAVVAPVLVRKIGAGRARRVLLTGGLMSGQQAFDLGLVDHVVPTLAELDSAAADLAARLAKGGPNALRATKDLLNTLDGSLDAAIAHRGADLSAAIVASPETQTILRAKLGK